MVSKRKAQIATAFLPMLTFYMQIRFPEDFARVMQVY